MLNEDENAHVRELTVKYLKLNNSFPLNPVSPEKTLPFSNRKFCHFN